MAERLQIALLGPEVVERIAAGEVIERPASVVRELIENTLDSGATAVRVELRDGGLRLVRVADDGCGIPAAELELAVAAHATNKVRSLADLERVHTLGFRGEALASVAAVGELHLCSAADQSGVAQTLTLRTGQAIERGLDARSRGTTITVRDLFHSVPARRAALRGPRGEERRALAVVRAYALAHPAVRFTATADGALVFQTPGTSPAGAVSAIYGADVAHALLPLEPLRLEGATIAGWIAPRAFSQANREHVLLCVNARPVSNRALLAAIESGYRPLLRKGRHPIACVLLDVEPSEVDVNVHPAKVEVLIRGERALAAALRDAVHASLGREPAQTPLRLPGTGGSFAQTRQYGLPWTRRRGTGMGMREPRPRYAARSAESEAPPQGPLPALEPLGQLDAALIVARTSEGHLYLVDQHRAHERLLYETLRRERAPAMADEVAADALRQGSGQLLLEPLAIDLTPRQAEILRNRLDELAALGLVCEPFGGAMFLVRAVPMLPGAAVGVASFAGELAADAAEDAEGWFEHVRVSLACRGAIRRGQALAPAEQQALLADLRGAQAPAVCPHGSPILLRYTQSFLARAFEW
jgi:DNA mismatch repair protein MutL